MTGRAGVSREGPEYKHSEKWQRKYELLVYFDTNQWRTAMSARDFCFGRRFHGCIIGMQAGTPAPHDRGR